MPNIRVIPPTVRSIHTSGRTADAEKPLRVAAYCRVSTDSDEQAGSYEAQIEHYIDKINNTAGWSMAGIYADDGISATTMLKREQFNKMIEDAHAGRIDMIITKSISRFARNTVDCLKTIRDLKDLHIPVLFEKENINTMESSGELLLTIMASLSQQESQSISQNVKMGIQYRFQQGKVRVNHSRFLGYTKDKDTGSLVIVEEEAKVVRRIYRDFLNGAGYAEIARALEADFIANGAGNLKWHPTNVKQILCNEKYVGDALLQKTVTTDFLSKRRVKNDGSVQQYYVEGDHPPIIPREVYYAVQEEIAQRAGQRGEKHYLTGRVICTECGEKLTRHTWSVPYLHIVWRCKGRVDGNGCRCRTVQEEEILSAVGRAVRWAVKERKGFIERLKATGYFFPERVEMLEEAAFAALPDPGEEEECSLTEYGENVEALVRALVQRVVVSENGIEIELRDGTVIEG